MQISRVAVLESRISASSRVSALQDSTNISAPRQILTVLSLGYQNSPDAITESLVMGLTGIPVPRILLTSMLKKIR